MKWNTVLFDLDGTLLPMDQDVFVKGYFGLLAKRLVPMGYDKDKLIAAVWKGTAAMVMNDGTKLNEEAFWDCFAKICGEQVLADKPVFEDFYRNEFQQAKACCGFNAEAASLVHDLKAENIQVVLATNPIFPAIATESRIRWAGLKPSDFSLYTTYENTGYCKPNPAYYQDILERIGKKPEECLMVGNDATEDLAAKKLGIEVFLLTDCLINKEETDLRAIPHGGFRELRAFLELDC